jgi:hypothetical protein
MDTQKPNVGMMWKKAKKKENKFVVDEKKQLC